MTSPPSVAITSPTARGVTLPLKRVNPRWEDANSACPLWKGESQSAPRHYIFQEKEWNGRKWLPTGREHCTTCSPFIVYIRDGKRMNASRIIFSDSRPHPELIPMVLERIQLPDKRVRWQDRAACYCHKQAKPACQDPKHDMSGYLILDHRGLEFYVDIPSHRN